MADVYTYDSKDVNLILDGKFITGLAEGEAIEANQNEENFSKLVGMKGDVVLSETADKTGVVKFKLTSTSPSCAFCEELARRNGENALVPVQVVDLTTGGITVSGNKARIKKTADKKWGSEATEREYELEVLDYTTK